MLNTDSGYYSSLNRPETNMAIFGNFKGTTQSEFKIGKRAGNKISAGSIPDSGASTGDIHIDADNSTMQVYTGSAWTSVGNTLTDLNVDSGTLFVNSSNDTVSIGAVTSNEKLFVNGNMRLGVNPSLQYSGAYMDMRHSNGSTTNIRVRDNTSGTDPIFKVFTANNETEALKVQGANVVIHESYKLPTTDGTAGQVMTTDGNGAVSFSTLETGAEPAGANNQIQYNIDGELGASSGLTYDDENSTLETGVVRGVIFEQITDYGLIIDSANTRIDYGLTIDTVSGKGNFEFLSDTAGVASDSYSVNKLPDAAQPGQMIFVEDAPGGATMAFSDGNAWRKIHDRTVISAG